MPTKPRTAQPKVSPADRARSRKRPILKMTICDDLTVKTAYESARYSVRRLKAEAEDRPNEATVQAALARAETELTAAQEAYDAEAYDLRFEALPRTEFEDLKKAHPPTEAQAEDGYDLNVDTFGPALVAAASLDGLTVDDARTFLDTWSEGDASTLFNTAWGVQQETRTDVGKG
ncbi:hypothetical protein [Streptomyces sp. NPDC096351]|uniref:hypothetical protein n=1 Tax=Streptomyces sp. NPDC096351 TaxID=3366087 RepID=UPI00381EA650